MKAAWRIVRRVGLAVGAVYLVISSLWAFVTFTPDANLQQQLALAQRGGTSAEELQDIRQTYLETRNRDKPLLERYTGWLVDITLLDWGWSYSQHRPVLEVLDRRLPATLRYVVPALVMATVGGLVMGLYSATHRGQLGDAVGRFGTYFGLGMPDFWLAEMSVILLGVAFTAMGMTRREGISTLRSLQQVVLPSVVLATSLLATQARFTRAEAMEYVDTDFVRLVRSKGAGKLRVARHVLRNASVPLTSLFVTEMLGVLVLNIYVIEFAFNIPGFANASYVAIEDRDLPLILGTTMVMAFVGIGGSLLQDLAAGALDPRVDDDLYQAGAELRTAVAHHAAPVVDRLPTGAVTLLADPDRFFRERSATALLPSASVVVAAGFVGLLPTLFVRQATASAGPATTAAGVGAAVAPLAEAAGPFVRTLLAWVAVAVAIHGVARLLGGRGSLRETLRLSGWGWTPALLFGAATAVATALAVGAATPPGSAGEVGRFLAAVEGHFLVRTLAPLGAVVTAWQGFIWLFAARHAHGLDHRAATLAAAVPAGVVVTWNTATAVWGTPGWLLDAPLLPWLLGAGGIA